MGVPPPGRVWEIFESDIQVEGVNYEQVGLYLALSTKPNVMYQRNQARPRCVPQGNHDAEVHLHLQKVGARNEKRNGSNHRSNKQIITVKG